MGMELKQTPTGGVQLWDDKSGGQGAVMQVIGGTVNRGATNTQALSGWVLPANAQICDIVFTVSIVSNAATTATVSVGLSGGSATAFTAAQDIKTAIGTFRATATAGWAPSASSQALSVTYTETGTASTAGTCTFSVYYIVN